MGSIPTCGSLEVWQWTFGSRTVWLVNKSAGQPQFYVHYVTIILIIFLIIVIRATIIFYYVTVILIISVIIHIMAKNKIDICVRIHYSNHANRSLHHRGFKFLATNTRIDSFWDHRGVSSHCNLGLFCDFWIGVTDVFEPSGAHSWTKSITQIIKYLGNCCLLILPHVISNPKVGRDTNLKNNEHN